MKKGDVADEGLMLERLKEEIKLLKGKNMKQDRENDRQNNLLVDVEDSHYQMGLIVKSGLRILETLPDSLERDFELDPVVIMSIETKIDLLRHEWANYLGGTT